MAAMRLSGLVPEFSASCYTPLADFAKAQVAFAKCYMTVVVAECDGFDDASKLAIELMEIYPVNDEGIEEELLAGLELWFKGRARNYEPLDVIAETVSAPYSASIEGQFAFWAAMTAAHKGDEKLSKLMTYVKERRTGFVPIGKENYERLVAYFATVESLYEAVNHVVRKVRPVSCSRSNTRYAYGPDADMDAIVAMKARPQTVPWKMRLQRWRRSFFAPSEARSGKVADSFGQPTKNVTFAALPGGASRRSGYAANFVLLAVTLTAAALGGMRF